MKNLLQKIKDISKNNLDEIIGLRRHFHANPELAFNEIKTGDAIAEYLDKLEIPFTRGIAKTGVVAVIKGINPEKRVIGLRADMDALPITERTAVDFCSKNPGVMHACGHDVHMASMLGTTKILWELRKSFEGTIKILFQPSEEKYPGGALMMINEGVLKNPVVDLMIGQHVHPAINSGKVGFKPGKAMASTDEIYITVKGKGGHAATPELNIDPVVIAAQIIVGLQQIVSRVAVPTIPTVLSFGRIVADGKTNVIPDEVFIEGTLRTVDENWRKKVHAEILQISQHIAEAYHGSCEVFIDKGYPYLFNDEVLTGRMRHYAMDYLGSEFVEDIDLRMTAEDFAYFSQQCPSCFYRLGVKSADSDSIYNLHTSTFTVDENALEVGMGFMAWAAINELSNNFN